MAEQSAIEWTDATWGPVTGCTKVSPGCDHCYAERLAHRLKAMGNPKYANAFELTMHDHALELPLRWRQPKRIFVNSMSDLFHVDVPDEFISRVFDTMARCPQHVFQILTKRSGRMRRWFAKMGPQPPLPNVWIGVSVESSRYCWRVNDLRQIPAAVRFISAEPLLGPLDGLNLEGIHWLISGGESGPGFRVCDENWVRGLRDRCVAEGVAYFHKQWGGRTPKVGGRLLDGRTWDEYPQTLLG
jgi:protein gp37